MISPVGISWIWSSIMMCLCDFVWVSFFTSSHSVVRGASTLTGASALFGYRRKRDDIHKRWDINRERWSKSGCCRIYPSLKTESRYRCVKGVQDLSHSQMCTIIISSLTLSRSERWESAVRASSRLQHPVLDIPGVNTGGAHSISPAHTWSRYTLLPHTSKKKSFLWVLMMTSQRKYLFWWKRGEYWGLNEHMAWQIGGIMSSWFDANNLLTFSLKTLTSALL